MSVRVLPTVKTLASIGRSRPTSHCGVSSMKQTLAFLCAIGSLLAAACGDGSTSPAAPSQPASVVSSGTSGFGIGQPATPSLFGSGEADLASCLRGGSDPACFSGSRLSTRAVGAATTAPEAPLNFSATASGSTVLLTWTAPVSGDPVTTYVIEAGSRSGASDLTIIATNSTAPAFSASGVGAGTYYVRVRAQNAGGVSSPSNESILIVGTGGCTTPPNAPGGLVTSASGTAVTLTWMPSVGGCAPTAYLLQAGSAPGQGDLANSSTGTTATSYVAQDVGAGTYYVRIRAVNAYGTSGPSNESILIVGTGGCTSPPNPPGGLVTSASGTTVTLTWTAPVGGCAPTAYLLQAGSAPGLSDLANSNTGTMATSYVAQGVGASTYYVRIRTVNAYGTSGPSNESILVVGVPPRPEVWTATAGFGTFELTLNPAGTAITQIAYHFQTWRCGGTTRSGGITVSSGSGWPITNQQFSIENSLSGFSMSIRGSFASSVSASGSWSAISYGTGCSGTWTASK